MYPAHHGRPGGVGGDDEYGDDFFGGERRVQPEFSRKHAAFFPTPGTDSPHLDFCGVFCERAVVGKHFMVAGPGAHEIAFFADAGSDSFYPKIRPGSVPETVVRFFYLDFTGLSALNGPLFI